MKTSGMHRRQCVGMVEASSILQHPEKLAVAPVEPVQNVGICWRLFANRCYYLKVSLMPSAILIVGSQGFRSLVLLF